jgi:hypothetical protein
LPASLLRVVRIATEDWETRSYGVGNSLLTSGQLAVTSLWEDDFEFLGEKFFEFSYLMKAEDLFTWHYRNFIPYPEISENCFLHSSFTFPLFIGVTE